MKPAARLLPFNFPGVAPAVKIVVGVPWFDRWLRTPARALEAEVLSFDLEGYVATEYVKRCERRPSADHMRFDPFEVHHTLGINTAHMPDDENPAPRRKYAQSPAAIERRIAAIRRRRKSRKGMPGKKWSAETRAKRQAERERLELVSP